jgi:hypothetical protein
LYAEVSLTLSLHPVRLPAIPLSHSPTLPLSLCLASPSPSPGAAAQRLELTERGIINVVDEHREEAERVEQEIRLNITNLRADIQVALFVDLSSFRTFVS